jgi:hypothetical protein
MNSIFTVDSASQITKPLLSGIFISAFLLINLVLMYALFPKQRLMELALTDPEPQPMALYYIKQLSQADSTNHQLRIALVKQQIGNNEWRDARRELDILAKEPGEKNQVRWLNYRLQSGYAYSLLATNPKRETAMQLAKKEAQGVMDLAITPILQKQLASDLLGFGDPAGSLKLYLRMATTMPTLDRDFILQVAKVASFAGNHKVSGDYYFLAASEMTNLKEKRSTILLALQAYQGGGLLEQGLTAVNKLPETVTDDDALLDFLTSYALAANRPDLAQAYVRRSLLLTGEADKK